MAAAASVVVILAMPGFPQKPSPSKLVLIKSFDGFEESSRCEFLSSTVYLVAERGRHRIGLVGKKSVNVGGEGWGENSFDQPAGMCSNGLSIYVADYGNRRVVRLDNGLHFVSSFGPTVFSDGKTEQLGSPVDVALSLENELIVLDGENNRAVAFSREGKFIRSFGDVGSFEQRMHSPRKLRTDDRGNILVLDQNGILEYDQFGFFVNQLSLPEGHEIRGFGVRDSLLLLATESSVLWCSRVGRALSMLGKKELIADGTVESIQDIALRINLLLILTSHRLFVYEIDAP
jgi:hypothetical protein